MKKLNFPARLCLCLFSGFLVCLSFPSFLDKSLTPWGAPLIWVALVPFFIALERAEPVPGALLGWVFGFVYLGGILYWIAFLQEAQNLSGLAWASLVLYLSLYFLLFGGIASFARKYSDRFSVLWMAFLWITLEQVRGTWPFGGFPWGQLGYACAPYPAILSFTSYFGVLGLTFLMVWFNAMVARGIDRGWFQGETRNLRWLSTYFLFPAGLLLGIWIWGNGEIHKPAVPLGVISILQPNVDQSVKWDKRYENDTFGKMRDLTRRAAALRPDLILWPETAAPSFLLWSSGDLVKVSTMVSQSRVPALVGCLDMSRTAGPRESAFNAAVHFSPRGKPEGVYRKRHLVPFGEYVPFQKYLFFLGPVVRDLGDFEPGPAYCRFSAGAFSYTPLICYEAIFPGDVRSALQNGAEVLVNISNDAWYGRTASAYQHAMMAVVRSAEERKPLFRAANTGVSLATDPYGRLLGHTALYQEDILTEKVWTAPGPTFYFRWGDWLPKLGALVSVIWFAVAVFRKRRGADAQKNIP